MELRILDVSRHQGIIDWDKVNASSRIDGVMLRALGNSAEGKPSKPYLDPTFERNYTACTRLGIPVGAYYYARQSTRHRQTRSWRCCTKRWRARRWECLWPWTSRMVCLTS